MIIRELISREKRLGSLLYHYLEKVEKMDQKQNINDDFFKKIEYQEKIGSLNKDDVEILKRTITLDEEKPAKGWESYAKQLFKVLGRIYDDNTEQAKGFRNIFFV